MAQINKPDEYFNTVTYNGSNSDLSVTGVGFQPDFCWVKRRSGFSEHELVDAVRGTSKLLSSDTTGAELDRTFFISFDVDGFSVQTGVSNFNNPGETYVSWNWLANNTSGSSNTDGSITSTVSANTTSGFSIVSYTGTGANATIGHGLGVAPKVVIIKNRDSAVNWMMYNEAFGDNTKSLSLNNNSALDTSANFFNSTSPTSTVFSVGTNVNTGGASNFIAYCFAEKKGFSKFSSYVGNNNNDGTFVYTGFKPAFVMVKRSDSNLVANWSMFDNKRSSYNIERSQLEANTSDPQQTDASADIDLLSNGFKLRSTADENNDGGGTYIYMAFAENPLVGTNNIPATAR